MTTSSPIKVGIIGLGRSGWGIHANIVRALPAQFRVVAVTDALPERLRTSAAELGCRAHADAGALLADPEVELAIVATFNNLHAPQACQALAAGKHVLCEKPFGLTTADVDRMMAAAHAADRLIIPFQQRRYEQDYRKIREVIASGVLGEVVHVRICWHAFKRRWDWQTSRTRAGGTMNNNGPHLLDHALCFFGDGEPQVWAQTSRHLCSGDAEDHLKVILTGKGHPTVEVELTDVWAFPQDRWTVCGTAGGLRGNEQRLEWKWVDWRALPPRPLDLQPTPDRSYNSEKLPWQTASWQPEGPVQAGGAGAAPPSDAVMAFYQGMYAAIRHGTPLPIPPAEVRRRVAVMEQIRAATGMPVSA